MARVPRLLSPRILYTCNGKGEAFSRALNHCPVSRVPCPVPRVPCPVSRVPCPVSRAPCPVSRAPCPVWIFSFPAWFFFYRLYEIGNSASKSPFFWQIDLIKWSTKPAVHNTDKWKTQSICQPGRFLTLKNQLPLGLGINMAHKCILCPPPPHSVSHNWTLRLRVHGLHTGN